MTRLYKRVARLTVAHPRVGVYALGTVFNAIVIDGLRIAFQIEKTLDSTPNTCRITVYNASASTRAELQMKPLHVTLEAGYESSISRLFAGDLRWGQPKRSATEWESLLELGDGERAYKHARINRSYKRGTSNRQILKDLAGSMGFGFPRDFGEATGLLESLANGAALSGPSSAELDKLTRRMNAEWSIQDGQLQVLPAGSARANVALDISEETGMIGTPEFGPPSKPGEKPTLSVSTLLEPRLRPGCKIKVTSDTISGVFRVERVSHLGDTDQQDWFSTVEAKPI